VPCAAAGCFTVSASRAAPVRDAQALLPTAGLRAIVANSGNANALVGEVGAKDVRDVCSAVAAALGVDSQTVVAASTGVIGVRLPVQKLVSAARALAEARGPAIELAAEAVMTTDTRIKLAGRSLRVGDKDVTIAANGALRYLRAPPGQRLRRRLHRPRSGDRHPAPAFVAPALSARMSSFQRATPRCRFRSGLTAAPSGGCS
jgi:hypothetical protein